MNNKTSDFSATGITKKNIPDGLILLLIISPFIFISWYNHPIGDDYWFSSMVRKYGFIKAQSIIYQTVSARFTALTIMRFNPLVFGNFWLYKMIPIAFFCCFFLMVTFLIKTFYPSNVQTVNIFKLGASFTVIYITLLPGLGEGIYWVSSLVVYQAGILFFLAWIACQSRYFLYGSPVFYGILSAILFLALLGFNEPLALLTCFLNAIILVCRLILKKNVGLPVLSIVLSVPLLSYILNSPSFSLRYLSAVESGKGLFLYSVGTAVLLVGYHVGKCLLNPFFWIGVILVIPPLMRLSGKSVWNFEKPVRGIRYIFFLWFLAMFLIAFGACYFSADHIVPLRISNLFIFIFLTGLLFLGLFFIQFAQDLPLSGKLRALKKFRLPGVLILMAAGLIFRNNVSTVTQDLLSGTARLYDREMRSRYHTIIHCESDTCVIPILQHRPVSLRYSTHDNDRHIGEYFHKFIQYQPEQEIH
jgi:hypothetical protein